MFLKKEEKGGESEEKPPSERKSSLIPGRVGLEEGLTLCPIYAESILHKQNESFSVYKTAEDKGKGGRKRGF